VDRQGAALAARVLALGASAFLLAAAANLPPLKAARWLAPQTDFKVALGTLPTECVTLPKGRDARWRVEVGRAAFRSTVLFGGQAGRAGLSCNACHVNGRTNPDFQFPGLSGAPGTADITSFLMSPKRGKDEHHFKPIPNLSGPKTALRIDQDPRKPDLEGFIHGIVTEEFDGREPPPAVMDGLASYVRALSPGACPKPERIAQSPRDRLEDIRRALRAADGALLRRDAKTADVMVESARSQLGLIYERYPGDGLERPRAELKAADLALASLRDQIDRGDRQAHVRIAEWIASSSGLEKTLVREQSRSLFNPQRLG
jgi:hypothetical protein